MTTTNRKTTPQRSKNSKDGKPFRVVELFSGIGAQRMALDRAHIPYEIVGICDIDPYANISYEAIHGKTPMLGEFTDKQGRRCGDVTKIKHLPKNVDIMTYSFPCTDLSIAHVGGKGLKGEHSGLLWAVRDILVQAQKDNNLPRYLIMENVPQVFSPKNKKDWDAWMRFLEALGYTSKSGTLNAKDFDTGQNRNRAFMISHLGADCPDLPVGTGCNTVMADFLEDEVDDKYYLTKKRVAGAMKSSQKEAGRGNGFAFKPLDPKEDVAHAVTTHEGSRKTSNFIDTCRCKQVGTVDGLKGRDSIKRVYGKNGLCPTVTTSQGGNRQPKVLEGKSTIRKLTPKETWRAQGFSRKKKDGTWDDRAFDKASKAVVEKSKTGRTRTMSDAQLYKQSGNSIAVPVMKSVLKSVDDFDASPRAKSKQKKVTDYSRKTSASKAKSSSRAKTVPKPKSAPTKTKKKPASVRKSSVSRGFAKSRR